MLCVGEKIELPPQGAFLAFQSTSQWYHLDMHMLDPVICTADCLNIFRIPLLGDLLGMLGASSA